MKTYVRAYIHTYENVYIVDKYQHMYVIEAYIHKRIHYREAHTQRNLLDKKLLQSGVIFHDNGANLNKLMHTRECHRHTYTYVYDGHIWV